jgi:hypothetical protein
MFSLLSNEPVNQNFKKNLNKLEYIVLSSMRHNTHKKNYNAGAIILVRKMMPKVANGNIKGAQKENFRKIYNKYVSTVNNSATSAWAQKIANDPYLMKRFFNRRAISTSIPNRPRYNRPVPIPSRPRYNRPVPIPSRPRYNRPVPIPSRPRYNRPVPIPSRNTRRSKCVFKKLSVTGKPIFSCI